MKAKRLISIVLATAMIVLALFSLTACGEKTAMSLTVDGKTYTVSTKELDFLFPYMKWQTFYNYGWSTANDTDVLWRTQYSAEDGSTITYDESLTTLILAAAKNILVEKYLYEKYGSPEIDGTKLVEYRAQLKSMVDYYGYGKEGYYKKYFGYTSEQEYNYYIATLRDEAIRNSLFGENGTEKASDEEIDAYFTENYVSYEFIVLDMNNAVVRGEDGKRVHATKTEEDDNGNKVITELEKYETKELSTEEKEEKQMLPETLKQALAAGTSFEELAERYSDGFISEKYPNGFIVKNTTVLFDETVANKIHELEVGEYTEEGISVSNDSMVYFAKRVELREKAYNEEDNKDILTEITDSIHSDRFTEISKPYAEMIVVDEKVVSRYKASKAYLTDFVDVAYYSSMGLQ
ncbi:MAG: hypothetical protein KBS76_01460 [Ruminococcus sp.]|nr:hypothetical protein [Candidatus Apopatosoma intestinale]